MPYFWATLGSGAPSVFQGFPRRSWTRFHEERQTMPSRTMLTTGLQKVSVQIEVSKRASQIVLNDQ